MAGTATTPTAPPYEMELFLLDIPARTSPDAMFRARPRDEFVDQARAVCITTPLASFPADAPATFEIVIEGSKLKVSEDGFVSDGMGRMAFDDFLVDLWSIDGFPVFDTVRAQLGAGPLRDILDATRAVVTAEVTGFLTTFETKMLSTLESELEKAKALAGEVRHRYVDAPPPQTGPSELQLLRDDLAVLVGVARALHEHERIYKPLSDLQRVSIVAQAMVLPLVLGHFVPQPPPDQIRETFGPVLGRVLEDWFGEEIADYRTGRDALLRAAAAYLAGARRRHPIIVQVWQRLPAMPSTQPGAPTEAQVAAAVAELCDAVVESSSEALDQIANGEGYRLLLQHVTVVKEVPHEDVEGLGDVRSGLVAEHLRIDVSRDPLAALAGAMVARDSVLQRLAPNGLAGPLNTVSVWDLDALRATTLATMGEEVGPVQHAALALLDRRLLSDALKGVAKDFAGQTAVKLVLAPTGVSEAAELLLDAVDGMYTFGEYVDKQRLANSELLVAAPETRRIMSHDPSMAQLFLACVGIIGDAAAIARLPRLARALGRLQLLAFIATAGPELVAVLAKVAIAQDDADAKARRP